MTARERNPVSRNYQKHTNPNPIQQWLLGRFHERVAGLVREALPAGGQVLDVGCGEGFVAGFLRERYPDLRITGLDGSPDAVRFAAAAHPESAFARCDAARLPIAHGAVDLVICLEVLEHLYNPDATLAELGRATRGPVIVSTPNQPFFAGMNLARLKNIPQLGDDPEHVQWWTGPAFAKRVGQTLTVERVVYSLPWTIVVARRG